MVFYDELDGEHTLPDKFDVFISNNYTGDHCVVVGSDNKSFSLYFASTANSKLSKLPDLGEEYEIVITYKTKVDSGSDKIVGNTARLTANGKTEISVVPKKTLKTYSFTKTGAVDSSGKYINWIISLAPNLLSGDMPLTVNETISANHEYVKGSAKIVTIDSDGGQNTVSSAIVLEDDDSKNSPKFRIFVGESPEPYYRAYQT